MTSIIGCLTHVRGWVVGLHRIAVMEALQLWILAKKSWLFPFCTSNSQSVLNTKFQAQYKQTKKGQSLKDNFSKKVKQKVLKLV